MMVGIEETHPKPLLNNRQGFYPRNGKMVPLCNKKKSSIILSQRCMILNAKAYITPLV